MEDSVFVSDVLDFMDQTLLSMKKMQQELQELRNRVQKLEGVPA